MTEFTASNGVSVRVNEDGDIYLRGSGAPDREWEFDCNRAGAGALREFFQHERDEELGRWRWPENPEYVVKHDPLGVRIAHVLHEPSFAARVVRLDDQVVGLGSKRDVEFLNAARAYFANHPEPKPWHRAKPEEIWLMGSGLHEFVALVSNDGNFRFADGSEMAVTEEFVNGRRIWPEDAS